MAVLPGRIGESSGAYVHIHEGKLGIQLSWAELSATLSATLLLLLCQGAGMA